MNFSTVFKQIVNLIEQDGTESQPRDMKVKEVILADFEIDPLQPIVNFNARPFNWKYFAGELAWYLHRDRSVAYINDYSTFWSKITNPGTDEINSNYGSLVITDEQFGWVIDSLRTDINSRQAIMFFNQPKFQFKENKDFVCTMYANFFIRKDTLHMKLQMRSNDIFFGLTYDAPFFSFLMQSIYLILKDTYPNLKLGTYFHYTDNLHYYERHFKLADAIKTEEPNSSPMLELKQKFIDYSKDGNVFLSDNALDFLAIMDTAKGRSEINYKNILSKYFTL